MMTFLPESLQKKPSTDWPDLWRSEGWAGASGSWWRTRSGTSTQREHKCFCCRWMWLWCRRTPAPRRPAWTSGERTPCSDADSWQSWMHTNTWREFQRVHGGYRRRRWSSMSTSFTKLQSWRLKVQTELVMRNYIYLFECVFYVVDLH